MKNTLLRVIIIDDNPAIHNDFINMFPPLGQQSLTNQDSATNHFPEFQFETATHGEEGVEKIKLAIKDDKPFALTFVGTKIPSSREDLKTIRNICLIDNNIQMILYTAYADYSWEELLQIPSIRDNFLVLNKPYDPPVVRQLVFALAKKWQLTRRASNDRTESLEHSLSLLRATLESSTVGILVFDSCKGIVDYNKQFVEIWNLPENFIANNNGQTLLELMLEKLKAPDEFLNRLQYLYKNIEESSVQILQFTTQKMVECSSHPYRVNEQIIGRVWNFHDITLQSSLQQKLEYQAFHDSLTDLPNRTLFNDRIEQTIATSFRHKSSFAMLFMDLDRFKLVNDSLTHHVGDELLKAVAERLLTLIRKIDTLARLGGDEFVMIIPDIDKDEAIVNVAQKILSSFETPFFVAKHKLSINTSIGISVYPRDGTTITTLLRNADLAMYQAKELGGNQFKFYTNVMYQQTDYRISQFIDLKQALKNEEFFLVFQPQMNINTQQIVSIEALIRWQHPEKGEVLPLDFIPTAEETGLIIPIGEWVLRAVCQQIIEWHKHGLPNLNVSVNVSNQQLKQLDFADLVKKILQEYKVKPKYLTIELTENIIITHTEMMPVIQQLKDLGITIILDNFRSDSSSMSYLKKLHIDRLKLDLSFVPNISKTRHNKVMMEAIIDLARKLDLKVSAEGIENQNQLDFLKTHDCNDAQGYFLSKPVSAKLIEDFFKKNGSQ